jgi:hypothetical protein
LQQGGHLAIRSGFQAGKYLPAFGGQGELDVAAIGPGSGPSQQSLAFKGAEDAAEITGVEAQLTGEHGGSRLIAMGHFVHDPDLGQEKGLW